VTTCVEQKGCIAAAGSFADPPPPESTTLAGFIVSAMRDEKTIRERLEQLRGQFLQWGTPDLRVFVTTQEELRGWIRAIEWSLARAALTSKVLSHGQPLIQHKHPSTMPLGLVGTLPPGGSFFSRVRKTRYELGLCSPPHPTCRQKRSHLEGPL